MVPSLSQASKFAFPLSTARSFACLFATFALLIPCYAAEENATRRIETLSTKLAQLLAAKPQEAEKTITHFANNIVSTQGGPSLGARLSDLELLELACDLGKALPADRKTEIQKAVAAHSDPKMMGMFRDMDRVLPAVVRLAGNLEEALAALAETSESSGLLAVIRDPKHKNNGDALIGLAILMRDHTGAGNFGTGRASELPASPGDVDHSFWPGGHTNVFTLVELSTGKLMAGTHFASGGLGSTSLARLNADGSTDTTFKCKANNVIFALAERTDGRMIFAAHPNALIPDYMDGISLGIAGPTGEVEPISGKGPYCFFGLNDGRTLIAGAIQFFGERKIFRNSIARLAADGSVDESFNAHVAGSVNSFAVQPDGKIVIGGMIGNVNGDGRNGIARILPDGANDAEFHPGWTGRRPLQRSKAPDNTGANGNVFCVALQPDGKILLAGEFTFVAGVRRNLLARLHPDGRLDESFDAMLDGGKHRPGSAIHSLALQADGKIIIGGSFTQVKGIGRNNLARLLSNGDPDHSFYPCPKDARFKDDKEKAPEATGARGRVRSISIQKDGKVLVGGVFDGIGGVPGIHMARLHNDPATSEVRWTGGGGIEWRRGGAAPEVGQAVLEKRDGDTWRVIDNLTRVDGGWKLEHVAASGELRIRATARGGEHGGSTSFILQELHSPSSGSDSP